MRRCWSSPPFLHEGILVDNVNCWGDDIKTGNGFGVESLMLKLMIAE